MNDIETIELFFDPSREGIDWVKRTPRVVNEQKPIISADTTNKQSEKNEIHNAEKEKNLPSDAPFRDIDNVKKYITLREKEVRKIKSSSKQKEFLGRLEVLLKIMEENDSYYEDKQQVSNCVNRINRLKQKFETEEHPLTSCIQKFNTEITESETLVQNIETISANEYTKRGFEIQTRLQELHDKIKQQGNIKLYRDNIKKELLSLQKEMTDYSEKFSKRDNINLRLSQIDNYLDKLSTLDEKDFIPKQIIEDTNTENTKKEMQNNNSNAPDKKKRMKVIWSHSLS